VKLLSGCGFRIADFGQGGKPQEILRLDEGKKKD